MSDFELRSLKFGNIEWLKTEILASMLIKNPSDIAITLSSFRVEILRENNGSKDVLAVSPTSELKLPANGNLNYDIKFNLSNLQMIKLLGNTFMNAGISDLKGKVAVLVKCTAHGQYVEQEIPYL